MQRVVGAGEVGKSQILLGLVDHAIRFGLYFIAMGSHSCRSGRDYTAMFQIREAEREESCYCVYCYILVTY